MDAQFGLGLLYSSGINIDFKKSAKWHRLAAEQGHAEAQTFLGNKYALGSIGLAQDDVYAYMWYNLAAANGYELAITKKIKLESSMTREQIAEARG